MRLRNKPWAKTVLEEDKDYVLFEITEEDKTAYKGKFKSIFNNDNPIHIEIGMGKGDFLVGMAKQNPNINYIGIEKYGSVQVIALKKIRQENLKNIRLMNVDAAELNQIFDQQEVGCIYLNFSDPWPKTKHEKRRLTYHHFLSIYQEVLINKGQLILKTDNRGLFEYSLQSFNQYPLYFDKLTLDLHQSEGYEMNVMSEYERRFVALGQPIYRVETTFKEV